MPALACVDANTRVPPPYALRDTGTLPAPESASVVAFGGAPPPATEAAAAATNDLDRPWSVDRSADLYRIHAWGAPYFSVNNSGNISVRPHGSDNLPHQEIDLMKVVKKASDPKVAGGLGLQLPLIVRFPDILKNRLQSLQSAFDFAIRSSGYNSHYQGVYPVKCNQDRYMVEDIVEFGLPFRFGLEVGSKPELLLAMSCLSKAHISPGAFLICNGYKDDDYVSLALTARKLDLNAIIVLEQVEELDTIIEASRRLRIRPVIGLRAKLRTKHDGHFGSTSGEKGKFGLTTLQILNVVAKLQKLDMMDCLQLLHFHIGSQIPSVDLLADGVSEAAQIYCELLRMGAAMKVFDIGGGLGIDYDGTRSSGSDMSVGYSLDEYACAVVRTVMYVCDRKSVSHPVICSESGRALVSHHSVLVFEATSSSSSLASAKPAPGSVDLAYLVEGLGEEARSEYSSLMAAAACGDCNVCLAHVEKLKWRCVERFKDGTLDLELLAAVDSLCDFVSRTMCAYEPVKTYHVNLSMFTSVPDFWGIGQLFPVTPIHRLDEFPAVKGVLSDITCDSDGKMDTFIGGKSSLPLHDLGVGGGSYYLGMFLGGAYQEALGGLHNLFGGPSVVRVLQSDGAHCFAVTRAVPGPSSADVLRTMQHEPEIMFEVLKGRAYDCAAGDALAYELAHAFNSMPYLVSGVTRLAEDERRHDVLVDDEERPYYTSGGDDSGDGSTCDDLDWDLRRCMLD